MYLLSVVSHGVLPGHPPVWTIGSGIPVSFPLDLLRDSLRMLRAVCWWVWDVGEAPCLLCLVTVRLSLSRLTL